MNLNEFKKFSSYVEQGNVKNEVWVYTRVSSKRQYDDNNSLKNQETFAKEYAKKNGFQIEVQFGGTYESAKGDFTRKEFKNMIERVRKSKNKPFAILIYKMSRFSRSGSGGISVVHELVDDLGVHLIETSTGKSTESPRGKNEILSSLVAAERENIERLEITKPGMIAFLREGNWLGNVPRGFDHYGPRVKDLTKIRSEQKIILNDEGRLLREAWQWKLGGMRDFEILNKLETLGLKISKQTLSKIWRNPFYCGVCVHSMLEGEAVKGNWEAMVSQEDFWEVQEILKGNNSGYKVSKVNSSRPLMGFVTCSYCKEKMTGYLNKEKGLHYYSCQNNCPGSTVNAHTLPRSKKEGINDIFKKVLSFLQLDKKYLEPFRQLLSLTINDYNSALFEHERVIKKDIQVLGEKLEKLDRKFAFEDLPKSVYDKLRIEIDEDLSKKRIVLESISKKISNSKKTIEKCVEISMNISNYWGTENAELSLMIQKLIFPEGIVLDAVNRIYLTNKLNSIFSLIVDIARDSEGEKKGTNQNNIDLSLVVAGTRLERATFGL